MQRIIDSHQHFWQLTRGDYGWLTPQLKTLYRDFLPRDLEPLLKELNIHGTIVVQAAPTIEETFFLLDLADLHPFILGVVGWVDMMLPDAPQQINHLAHNAHFRGIRPMIQDIPEENWLLRPEIIPSLKMLEKLNLTFDALVLPQHVPSLITLVEQHPLLKVVVDHGAKPSIKNNMLEPWLTDIRTLAESPNVYCKFSGLLTEAGENGSWEKIQPYVDHLFSCFGAERMMWGSDFPVINLVSDYREWFLLSQNYLQQLGPEIYQAALGGNAAKFYRV